MSTLLKRLALLLGALVVTVGLAQDLRLDGPPDRLAQPGDFVTLVFHLTSGQPVTAEIEVDGPPGFPVLGPPQQVEVRPGSRAILPVTVEIPADAEALRVVAVRVRATAGGTVADAAVRLTIGARPSVTLAAPAQVGLEQGGFSVTVSNTGNVARSVRLRATQDGTDLVDAPLDLAIGARSVVRVTVTAPGLVDVRVVQDDGNAVQRTLVRVVREGLAPPPPVVLRGRVSAAASSAPDASGSVELAGPLSDYVNLDAIVTAPSLDASHLELTGDGWTTRVGDLGPGPFELRVPPDVGGRATFGVGPFDVGAAASWLGNDRAAGYAVAGRRDPSLTWGVAAGMDSGAPLVVAHGNGRSAGTTWSVDGSWLRGDVGFGVRASQYDATHEGTATFAAAGGQLLGAGGRVDVRLGYADRDLGLYGSVTAPVGKDVDWSARVGAIASLPWTLPGQAYLQADAGPEETTLAVAYAALLAGGWQTSGRVGPTWTAEGQGWRFGSSWSFAPSDTARLGFDGVVTYFPGTDAYRGEVATRASADLGPLDGSVDASWDLAAGDWTVALSATRPSPSWTVRADASIDGSAHGDLHAAASVRAEYAFDLPVPEGLIAAAGGRRLGTVRVQLVGDGAPGSPVELPGVAFQVDGVTVRTDAQGRLVLPLAPGTHRIALEVGSLPIQYRMDASPERSIEVSAKQTLDLRFPVVAAGALRGSVLADVDGDGVADSPPAPVEATVRIVPDGLPPRLLPVAPDGTFVVRGLAPGMVRVEIADLPLGATAEGDGVLAVRVPPGGVATADFLVRPAAASAPTFSRSALRIRTIVVEPDRVPPTAAPIVRATVAGDPDRVEASVAGATVGLALQDGTWIGRLPIPATASPGVLPFEVVASSRDSRTTRRDQVVVDPSAPLYEAGPLRAVRAGEDLDVVLDVFAEATRVTFSPSFADATEAREAQPGRWVATLAVPASTADGVYEIGLAIYGVGAEPIEGKLRVRVLAP